MTVDMFGNLFIADTSRSQILKVGPNGALSVVAASSPDDQLNGPLSVAVDIAGNLYIADSGNHRIQRRTPIGVVTTIAGNGAPGYNGDGGPATEARFLQAGGVAVGPDGSVYVSDWNDNRIRKISIDGTIATVAGNGLSAFSGDGAHATQASLNGPTGVAVDAIGNLYFVDYWNHRLVKVSPDGIIGSVVQNRLMGGVALDSTSNLYFFDLVFVFTLLNGNLVVVAGNAGPPAPPPPPWCGGFPPVPCSPPPPPPPVNDGGPATSATFRPAGLAIDAVGNLYIADITHDRIRKVSTDGIITTIAGNGTQGYSGDGGQAVDASLNDPGSIVVDAAGNLYIADLFDRRVRMVSLDGTITTIADQLHGPRGVSVDAAGNVYVADSDEVVQLQPFSFVMPTIQ
jgi:sugar lactone lactonase YvrE